LEAKFPFFFAPHIDQISNKIIMGLTILIFHAFFIRTTVIAQILKKFILKIDFVSTEVPWLKEKQELKQYCF